MNLSSNLSLQTLIRDNFEALVTANYPNLNSNQDLGKKSSKPNWNKNGETKL